MATIMDEMDTFPLLQQQGGSNRPAPVFHSANSRFSGSSHYDRDDLELRPVEPVSILHKSAFRPPPPSSNPSMATFQGSIDEPEPEAEQPENNQELENLNEDDFVTVDISFLEGPDARHQDALPIKAPQVDSTIPPKTGEMVVHNTAREYGQHLANQKNMIVAVKEATAIPAVDLSSLEGSERRASTFKTASVDEEASFFYPADPEKPDWKPFSMTSPYLFMLITVSLGLAGVQEYLYQQSKSLESQGKGLIQFNNVAEIPIPQFFAWKYLPTIVMVTYGVLWQIMEYNVKRLEPYYQLSQPTGNIASKSLNLDYTTLFSYFVPYKAVRNRHWTVLVASVGAVLATTAAPSLQNASIRPIHNPNCSEKEKCQGQFEQFVHIDATWSRLVSVCLGLVAVMALVLVFQLRRKSGLLSDPKGIAGIASMATKSHILNDFQGMDTATDDDIHKRLRHRRYVLYKSSIWQGEYIKYTEEHTDQPFSTASPHPIALRRLPGIVFLIYLTFLVAAIPVVTYTNANVVAVKLPWLPVLLAVIAKQIWTALEFAVKMLEPFYALSQGNARPENTLTLDYQGIPYGVLPFQALLNKHYLVSLIGIGSILSDVLTVTSSSLSIKDETEESFMTSSAISTVVVFFLLCSAALALVCRRHYFVPRPPSTIASILAFVHQSHMLDDFVNTERFSSDQMRAMLVAKNKRYGLGWFRGRDEKLHCGVDEEPMLSRYVHGISYKDAQAGPWDSNLYNP
ncbi:conserved hypothetical protein [Talaromyces stipitatus ATCC 10500]|uniref:DUF3433 domain protein n=1 Tax=Talaromyces stipitatus (strain ATCC 10500 / CBS 375.48 / QM 6759 / NRRL 1006) TaxID=441959 RepID=B8M6J5_TALSN|nr:uncharacterized protein TSTA_027510 [Talaromyces stipitatus ATCC 10500]EED19457.1 conserved hypothetical protein [Talaromyces stipitatus ATCC 10500]